MQRHMQIQAKSSLTKKECLENWSLAKNDFNGQVPPLKSLKSQVNREISQESVPFAVGCPWVSPIQPEGPEGDVNSNPVAGEYGNEK